MNIVLIGGSPHGEIWDVPPHQDVIEPAKRRPYLNVYERDPEMNFQRERYVRRQFRWENGCVEEFFVLGEEVEASE